jgi:hypothetical protein
MTKLNKNGIHISPTMQKILLEKTITYLQQETLDNDIYTKGDICEEILNYMGHVLITDGLIPEDKK